MENVVDTSRISRSNAVVIGCAVAFFLGMTLVSLYGWSKGYPPRPLELFTQLMLAAVLIGRASGRYVCELDDRELHITRTSLFGFTRLYRVPYLDIIGMYQYAPKLVNLMTFRHTWRLQSALDNRPVWTVAYTATGTSGKPENRRVYVKMSSTMVETLQGRLAASIPATEESLAAWHAIPEK